MRLILALLVARILRFLTRLRGGGSAFPGLVLLKMVPDVLTKTLGSLPGGVIFVTGSNGKSTTATMLTAVLRAHGRKAFTNPAGGNLPQGLASAVVGAISWSGKVVADTAVLEVDEAYGPQIAKLLPPDWVVFTNLQVDQLNRFGEPENVFEMMKTLALQARVGVVVNEGDPNLVALGALCHTQGLEVSSVGVSEQALGRQNHGLVPAPIFFDVEATLPHAPTMTLVDTKASVATIDLGDGQVEVGLPAPGLHYAIDAALAVAAASEAAGLSLLGPTVKAAFSSLPPVYGRGETITYRGVEFSLTMMKNLPSLQVNLAAMTEDLGPVWIAVDEGTPDPSWIYDVDLGPLRRVEVLSGTKAWQWALLLEFREIPYGEVILDTKKAMDRMVDLAVPGVPVVAIVNYEQMMLTRRIAGYKELEGVS
jgi:lipid II isoglutaminyl synthase (glutamine-hydrolysing)